MVKSTCSNFDGNQVYEFYVFADEIESPNRRLMSYTRVGNLSICTGERVASSSDTC